MVKCEFSNGVVHEWDDTITLGSLITTYNDGYHILTRIEFRDRVSDPARRDDPEYVKFHPYVVSGENPPVFHYVKVLKGDGTKSKAITASCSSKYCRKVTLETAAADLRDTCQKANEKYHAIQRFL